MISCIFHLPHSEKTFTSETAEKCYLIFKDDYLENPNTLAVIRNVTVIDNKPVPKFSRTYSFDQFSTKFISQKNK